MGDECMQHFPQRAHAEFADVVVKLLTFASMVGCRVGIHLCFLTVQIHAAFDQQLLQGLDVDIGKSLRL